MNIYALEGHKVVCDNLTDGWEIDRIRAIHYLKIGKIYTVHSTIVSNNHTDVWLKEIPKLCFNSCFFKDVTPQSEELDKQHHDYKYFN